MVNNEYYFHLTKHDTNALKGIALLMLLAHHLFAYPAGVFDDIPIGNSHSLFESIGIIGKLCVSIFVFLSGYGLTVQSKDKPLSVLSFYRRRFYKLYSNYWLIWLLFVPLGVFAFNRTFDRVYSSRLDIALDFFGILNVFGRLGYNATWWFYSCIIVLYLLFPLFLYLLNKSSIYLFAVCAILSMHVIPYTGCIASYVMSFFIGMVLAYNKINISILPPPLWQKSSNGFHHSYQSC